MPCLHSKNSVRSPWAMFSKVQASQNPTPTTGGFVKGLRQQRGLATQPQDRKAMTREQAYGILPQGWD